MKSRVQLIIGSLTVMAAVVLVGCQADTAIGFVDGGGGSGGTGQPDTNAPGCPAGPAAPLGDACSTADQVCAYGYNVPHCGGRTVICNSGHWAEQSHTDPETACFDAGTDADTNTPSGPEASVDVNHPGCCPRDTAMSGCMHLGGSNVSANSCAETCDFFCSTNWRVETDSNGCQEWKYDHRAPAPGENLQCMIPLNGGNNGDGGPAAETGQDAADADANVETGP